MASFPTSYIPTEGSTVTRAADVASITGTNFSSWYRQDEGTLFADTYRANAIPAGSFAQIFYMFDGTGSNTLNIGYLTANASQFRVRRLGNNEANILPNISSLRRVTAGAYAADAAASESGATAVVVGSVTLPTGLNQVQIGNDHVAGTPLNGTIRRLTYWPTRLPDSTLQGITQQ